MDAQIIHRNATLTLLCFLYLFGCSENLQVLPEGDSDISSDADTTQDTSSDAEADSDFTDSDPDEDADEETGPIGPPWTDCPEFEWSDKESEARLREYLTGAQTGDACINNFGCVSTRDSASPYPGLDEGVTGISILCMRGRLVYNHLYTDCEAGQPTIIEREWLPDECQQLSEGTGTCVRMSETRCCVDYEVSSLVFHQPHSGRICNDSCDYALDGGQTWDQCPPINEALVGERCTGDWVCPSEATKGEIEIERRWCDDGVYRFLRAPVFPFCVWE